MSALNTAFENTSKPPKKGELFNAIESRKPEEAMALLERGADPNEKGRDNHTALIVAAVRGYTDLVNLLIEKGALLNTRNDYGYTALISAAAWGYADTVRLLIEKGIVLDEATKREGNTALMEATLRGHTEVVRLLVGGFADINRSLA
jgi:ankyrin repeat protein